MCGIWGLFGSPHPDVFKYLDACLRIKHRGPDAFRIEGDHHLPKSCLAFHRLCIMDDLHGMQVTSLFSLGASKKRLGSPDQIAAALVPGGGGCLLADLHCSCSL